MTAQEAGTPVEERLRTRQDRPASQVTLEVVREGRRALIARGRLGFAGLRDDGAEIAAEPVPLAVRAFRRSASDQQRPKQQAELKDVRRRRQGLAPELFGTRPRRRHQSACGRPFGLAGVQQPGNPEIEQLDASFRRHKDVRWFEVAMDDQVAMGRGNRFRRGDDEANPLVNREASRVAVVVDRDAIDELHHQEGASPVVRAAVEQTAHVGMLQAREDAALAMETLLRLTVRERQRQQLPGRPAVRNAPSSRAAR